MKTLHGWKHTLFIQARTCVPGPSNVNVLKRVISAEWEERLPSWRVWRAEGIVAAEQPEFGSKSELEACGMKPVVTWWMTISGAKNATQRNA